MEREGAVFPTDSLLELGGDECDNLNFMNFKIDSFKIRKKNSPILGTFKFAQFEFAVYGHDALCRFAVSQGAGAGGWGPAFCSRSEAAD